MGTSASKAGNGAPDPVAKTAQPTNTRTTKAPPCSPQFRPIQSRPPPMSPATSTLPNTAMMMKMKMRFALPNWVRPRTHEAQYSSLFRQRKKPASKPMTDAKMSDSMP